MNTKSVRDYVYSLTYQEFSDICALKNSPEFCLFLAETCRDPIVVARFTLQCKSVGVPEEFISSADSLHYLVVAINKRSWG